MTAVIPKVLVILAQLLGTAYLPWLSNMLVFAASCFKIFLPSGWPFWHASDYLLAMD